MNGTPYYPSFTFRFLTLAVLSWAGSLSTGCDEKIRSAATPTVEVIPERFVFTKVQVGQDADRIVEVKNVGTGNLLIRRISFAGGNEDAEFGLFYKRLREDVDAVGLQNDGTDLFQYPYAVPGGESLFLVLNYRPANEQAPTGKIVLDTNLPNSVIEIPIELTDASAEINVSPTEYDFGRVPAGEVSEHEFQVSNIGQVPVEIRKILLNGSQDFVPLIDDEGTLKDPRRLDRNILKTLAPDEEMLVTVRYAPQVEGDDVAQMVISSTDALRPDIVVNLTANGATPCLKSEPPALEFLTSLVNRTDSRQLTLQSCGGASVEIVSVKLKEGSDPAFSIPVNQMAGDEGGDNWPTTLPAWGEQDRSQGLPPPSVSTIVEFTPTEQRIHNGTLVVESTDAVNPIREISLLGRGVENACPQARATIQEVTVRPLDTVKLDGSPSIDQDGPENKPIQYTWVITERPMGSVSQPVESYFNPADPASGGPADDERTPTSEFFIDIAGTYTAELRVTDNLGLDSVTCDNAAVVTIIARPEEAILVQLSWRTPGDVNETDQDGTDLDLHLLHPNAQNWGNADRFEPYDCYFKNPVPDWGQLENEADDPSLDIDDLNGSGPENVTLAVPEDTSALRAPYLVGVQYYKSLGRQTGMDYGPSFARLRVYLRGELAWEYEGQDDCADCQQGERKMEAAGHFWDVASIQWPGVEGEDQVTERDRYYTQAP